MENSKTFIKDLFRLAERYNPNRVKLDTQTVDRQHGDIEMHIEFEGSEYHSPEELYNYIADKYKSLREHSSASEFKENEVTLVDVKKLGNSTISVMEFSFGYADFHLQVVRKVV